MTEGDQPEGQNPNMPVRERTEDERPKGPMSPPDDERSDEGRPKGPMSPSK